MIYNENEITGLYYSGHTIVRAYGCNGELVFGDEPTPPTGMTGLKVSGLTSNAGAFSKECEEEEHLTAHELLPHDMPNASAITQLEVGTCVYYIGNQSLGNKPNVAEIILPSSIIWFREYAFLANNTNIQSLYIYATTPPRFLNYREDEWTDIFGYRYPSSLAPEGFKIYVPAASLTAYQTAEGWSHMADYYVAM